MLEILELRVKARLRFRLLLLFFYPDKRVKVTDITVKVSKGTLYYALSNLLRLGLVSEERVPPYTRFIKLTPQGQK